MLDRFVAVDLETTSLDVREARILQLAAQDASGAHKSWFVDAGDVRTIDPEVFRFTGIDPQVYEAKRLPLEEVLEEFLHFLGDRRLLGHNVLEFDLPVLREHLQKVDKRLPSSALPALDTLRLAHMVFPLPPEGLAGYRLGDLYHFFTGHPLEGAHQAQEDVRATWVVFKGLLGRVPAGGVVRAWRELGLVEGELYPASEVQLKDLLARPVAVEKERVFSDGKPFPHPGALGPELLPERRHAQEEMFSQVAEALREGKVAILEAPTGTGKTKGYLYPALHLGRRTWVATYTKVLQAQAMDELRTIAEKGYAVRAALVKTPKDTLCPDLLLELFLDLRREKKEPQEEEVRVAVGLLSHFASLGHYDLEALPAYWHFLHGFREARERVGTNPHRCREDCPFLDTCAYQKIAQYQKRAQVLVTNHAYLLTSFLNNPEEGGGDSLVVDEAHHLEDSATEALTRVVSHEQLLHLLNRLASEKGKKGLLQTDRILGELPEEGKALAEALAETMLPTLREKLAEYTLRMNAFLKKYGGGDPDYGLTLTLSPEWGRLEEWPVIAHMEEALTQDLQELRHQLLDLAHLPSVKGYSKTLLARDLEPLLDVLQGVIALFAERKRVLSGQATDPNQLHTSGWDPITEAWQHLAQPVDVSLPLRLSFWSRFQGVVLTSATLSVPTDRDPEGFDLVKRSLGLSENVLHKALPPSLPYEKAHFIVPRHLPEARTGTLPRFQRMFHQELKALLPKAHRSLTLFTSLKRMRDAAKALEEVPNLLVPLTRKEREDMASLIKLNPEAPVAALGSRSYMEGVDFPDLKLVNLERIPFHLPTPLLLKRMERVYQEGLDKWWDYYLPKAALSFAQAFGRLIRGSRERSGPGAFVLWDKKLLNAAYQELFFRVLPEEVRTHFPQSRRELYDLLSPILGVDRSTLPEEELEEETLIRIREILSSATSLEEQAERVAREVFGLRLQEDRWRTQLEAIQAALEGKDVVALLPTGFGKSLAFQIPALLQDGLTVVVSPLVALMKDQADRLLELGLPVGALHFLMSSGEQQSVLEEVRVGRIKLLYVSPERVNRSEALWKLLRELHGQKRLRRVVFDEAHCLVEWGYDFRPDYLKALEKLHALEDLPKSFFTATLTPEDFQRLKNAAHLQDSVPVKPPSFHRPNLRFVVQSGRGDTGKFSILARALVWLLRQKGSAIVYTTTRNEAERLAWALGRLFPDLGVEAYHAGMGAVPRREAQERFAQGETRVMVATSAFGMGIDQQEVRLVVHWRPPRSLEEYIQQAGRAGRDGKEAFALLLHTKRDWGFLGWLAAVGGTSRAEVEFAKKLMDLFEALPEGERSLRGYREEILERVYAPEEEPPLEVADDEDLGEDEEEEPVEARMDPEELERVLNSLERAGIIEYRYLPGKVYLLAPDVHLYLRPDALEALKQAGFQGRAKGDFLDLSRLPLEKAEELDRNLYGLYREGQVRVLHYREPAFLIQAGGRFQIGYRQWREEVDQQREIGKKRLKKVQRYVEGNLCRTQVLLKHLGHALPKGETCGCDVCSGDKGPWGGVEDFSQKDLERFYQPLDTLLLFFKYAAEHGFGGSPGGRGLLGRRSTLMALKGKARTQNSALSPRYTGNRFFGHLSFIPDKELERAFNEALERGFIAQMGEFQGTPLYGLTEKGRDYLQGMRREVGVHA